MWWIKRGSVDSSPVPFCKTREVFIARVKITALTSLGLHDCCRDDRRFLSSVLTPSVRVDLMRELLACELMSANHDGCGALPLAATAGSFAGGIHGRQQCEGV